MQVCSNFREARAFIIHHRLDEIAAHFVFEPEGPGAGFK